MKKKCPNCGFGYGEYDIFCARCGFRLNSDSDENAEFEALKKAALDNAKEFYDEKKKNSSKSEFFNSSAAKIYDSQTFNFALCVLIAAIVLSLILCVTLNNHKNKKAELSFKNLMNNPSLIPELKEPSDIKELEKTVSDSTNFMELYLKYSKDSKDKKQQIFLNYLKEMDKLPHLTNEGLIRDDLDACSLILNSKKAKYCTEWFDRKFQNIGITSYVNNNTLYFYPNYEFINKTYSKYLSKPMREYLALRAKYFAPTSAGLELLIKPKVLADKIFDFEKLYLFTSDLFVKEELEKIIFEDFRKFIFTPAIYGTTTQEMAPEFKKAYRYYISSKKSSALRPVVMSYMDKKRSYSEENFKNDYPYKIFEENFDENIENSVFSDIFIQLRKNVFEDNSKAAFLYVYNMTTSLWEEYRDDSKLIRGQYVISAPDENGNVGIYSNALSVLQEMNISKFSKLKLYKGNLYVYNSDKLSVSKVRFNGRQFNLQDLSFSDITSLFPGVEIISIDSYSNYNIFVEKDNKKASYIVLTRYSRGYNQYVLSPLKGSMTSSVFPNMFSVSSDEDVIISFHGEGVNPEETSESVPTYKFVIHTKGTVSQDVAQDKSFANYDEQTAIEEQNTPHEPNMMPKIINKNADSLAAPPEQKIEPPKED